MCEYTAAKANNLRVHKQSKHEGLLRYPWDECEYTAAKADNLSLHKLRAIGY